METRNRWKERLASVERRLEVFEEEAQRRLRELAQRSEGPRRGIEAFFNRIRSGGIIEEMEELRERAEKTGAQVLERLEKLPERAFEKMGLATRAQIAELSEQIRVMSRKLERLGKQARHAATQRTAAAAPRRQESRPDGGAAA